MTINLRIFVFAVAIFLYVLIFTIFKRGRIPFKYLLIWLFPITVILLVSVVPRFLEIIMGIIGMQTISNMVIGVLLVCILFTSITTTVIISGQTTKIQLLIQEISILKRRVEELESEDNGIDK